MLDLDALIVGDGRQVGARVPRYQLVTIAAKGGLLLWRKCQAKPLGTFGQVVYHLCNYKRAKPSWQSWLGPWLAQPRVAYTFKHNVAQEFSLLRVSQHQWQIYLPEGFLVDCQHKGAAGCVCSIAHADCNDAGAGETGCWVNGYAAA